MGYFGGVAKVSRGPWFRDYWIEDDGLDWFYNFTNSDGNKSYLLSNNLAIEDRNKMSHLYHTMVRNNRISWFVGGWAAFEIVTKDAWFKQLAHGWKGCWWLAIAYAAKSGLMLWSSSMYGPVMGAYLRKSKDDIKQDLFQIQDKKKEYFYIDTSQYMNYTGKDLSDDEYHCHHGPQPEGESQDSSWLVEVDKFLKGEENNLKDHKRFYNFPFELKDKSFPTAEAVSDLMHKTE
jgi:hypothetical protein|tara:strand:- start:304 stop:1002 length:699 start_codon:yes stop_codon:yes gene_type:complete